MITSPFLLVLLLAILPTFTNQQLANTDLKPDWSKCGGDVKCYCWDDSQKKVVLQDTAPTATQCKIGIQNRFFTEDSAVYQMQVLENTDAIGDKAELTIALESKEIFGCEFDAKTGKVTLKGEAEFLKKYKIQLFEGRSHCKEKSCLCAILVNSAMTMRTKGIESIQDQDQKYLQIKYTSTKPEQYSFSEKGVTFFMHRVITCAVYSFNDLTDLQGKHVLPLINRDKEFMDCKSVYGDSYSMRYIYEGKTANMEKLRCKKSAGTSNFEIVEKDSQGIETTKPASDPELFTFYCEAEINEVCEKPKEQCKVGPCPTYTEGKKNTPAKLECDGKKWLIGGEYVVLAKEPLCKEDIVTNPNDAAFFIERLGESDKKVNGETDRCFTEYDCKQKSKHVQFGARLDFSSEIVKCKDPKEDLSIFYFERNVTLTARNITCDKSTGLWKNTTSKSVSDGEPIDAASSVSCHVDPESLRKKVDATLSDPFVYGMISIALLLVLMIIGAGFTGYYLYDKKRTGIHDNNAWKKLGQREKIKYCEDMFGKVLKMETISRTHLMHGIRLVDLLLDVANSEPKIWNAALPFLKRFHGAIRQTDYYVFNMFTRYLYLEAKKIIDKHGWVPKDPIRRKTERKGLIRVVAVQLLGFCLDNGHAEDAFDLLEQGFRKMGFRGLENYPHCGLVWAAISHVRALKKTKKGKLDPKVFDYGSFACELRAILCEGEQEMPDNEVIPEFGQVYEQAAFALGGYPNLHYHEEKGLFILEDKPNSKEKEDKTHAKGTPFAYLKGICYSLGANPAQFVLDACEMWPNPNMTGLQRMREVMGEKKLNELMTETIRIMTYYGRTMDCKRFEERLMPETEQPSALLSGLVIEQQNFQRTMENELEELRVWFAANTDKKKWKSKPVYNTDPNIKLDDRVEIFDEKGKKDDCDTSKTVARKVKKGAGKQNAAPAETASSSKR